MEAVWGNLRASDTTTLKPATRSAGSGVVQGRTNLTAVGGLVAFTNFSHNVATTISIAFNAPGLTGTTSSNVVVSPLAFSQLQLLAPGETAAPGTVTGKSGSPNTQAAGTAFNVTVNAVDSFWNVISTNDTIAISLTDTNATAPSNAALVNGSGAIS